MSELLVTSIYNQEGDGSPNFPKGLTGTAATFTGSVSVGGTLTYEDVTNIDSVGLITARAGVKVNAGGIDVTAGGIDVTAGGIDVTAGGINIGAGGINAVGVVTANSFVGNLTGDVTGSGANLTNLPAGQLTGALPAISGANLTNIDAAPTLDLVASGAIADAAAVFMKSDGKVSQVVVSSYPDATGSAVNARDGLAGAVGSSWFNSCMIDDTRFALCWEKGEIKVVIGTISGTTITFGTIANGGNGTSSGNVNPDICYESQENVLVITFQDNSNLRSSVQAFSITGTNTLTAGTVAYNSSGTTYLAPIIAADGKGGGIQFWKNGSNGDGKLCGWTVSGNTITLGGGQQPSNNSSFNGTTGTTAICYHAHRDVFVICYLDGVNQMLEVRSRSGSSTSSNHSLYLGAGNASSRAGLTDASTIALVIYRDNGDWTKLRSLVINSSKQVSMTGYNTPGDSTESSRYQLTYNAQTEKCYALDSVTKGGNQLDFYIISADSNSCAVDTNTRDIGGNNDARATLIGVGGGQIVQSLTNSGATEINSLVRQYAYSAQNITPTTSNFIGFSAGAYTDGQTAKVKIVGNTVTKTGLTILTQYYITGIGTISSTADTPSIKAGMSISSNTLLINPPYGS